MKEKIKNIVWCFMHYREVRTLFVHVHEFKDYDKTIRGLKYAIYYGRLYYERSKYNNGMIDLEERKIRVGKILDEYHNPQDRIEYIKCLQKLRDGVIQANVDGFFCVGNNAAQNAIEAEHYECAMSDLNKLICGCELMPLTWKRVFLHH